MSAVANIFVLIDGLGWEWANPAGFLGGIAPYRRPLDTVLGFSTAAIPSILTGRYPEEHGRLTMFQRAENGSSPFATVRPICAMPAAAVENRYVRYAVKRFVAGTRGFSGHFSLYGVPLRYLPLLDVCEKHDIYQPGGIPGSTSIFDLMRQAGTAYGAYSYHQGSDESLMQRMEADLRLGEKTFYFLYLAEIDALLHAHADDPAIVRAAMAKYESAISHIYDVAKSQYREVRLHCFSDHGMAPTTSTFDVQRTLGGLPLEQPGDFLCLLDSTMARFWFFSDSARRGVMDALPEADGRRWLGERELRGLRAWFPDHRYGEEIYLMPEGQVIAPSFMGDAAPRGMHGFHPDTPHARSTFVSSVDYGGSVSHITDIFGLMRACI